IFAGGTFDIVERTPQVFMDGPASLSVEEGSASITRVYSVRTEDLRPGLQITWGGDGSVLSQGAFSTGISFAPGNAKAGTVLAKRVTVRVTDADGLSAEADRVISVHVVPAAGDGDGFPPVCRSKPWLPQCQLSMARLREENV